MIKHHGEIFLYYILNELIKIDGETYKEISKNATEYAKQIANDQASINRNIRLFEYALNLHTI